ncbi:LexA family protein [Paraburkholderia atlantica]|uniref:LexA family protein n=1 Tax=Paraburkholderia atlantica TaxID=2654982 RepID=UPI003D227821
MSLGDRIREKRKAMKLTLQQVGDVFGITRSSVSDWESGKTRPDQGRLVKLADVLNTSIEYLLSDKEGKPPVIEPSKKGISNTLSDRNVVEPHWPANALPVISWVQAGEWGEIVDNFQPGDADEWVVCPFPNSDFILKVVGESMYNPGGELSFRDGDYISVSTSKEPLHRSLVIAKRTNDQSATFKQLLIENDGVILLHALNPAWPTRYMTVDEHTRIVGVVTGQWRPMP